MITPVSGNTVELPQDAFYAMIEQGQVPTSVRLLNVEPVDATVLRIRIKDEAGFASILYKVERYEPETRVMRMTYAGVERLVLLHKPEARQKRHRDYRRSRARTEATCEKRNRRCKGRNIEPLWHPEQRGGDTGCWIAKYGVRTKTPKKFA